MPNFYDDWLSYWDMSVEERKRARRVIHEEEIQWVKTRQDARVGLLVAPETGFKTWGTVSMIAETPVGWHTGEHAHGEEAIHIVSGEGFSVVNGVRYSWARGSTVWIPFGARHQHFNTGPETVRYYSLMAVHLERFLGLHKMEQFGDCGHSESLPDVPTSTNGFDAKGRRIVLKWEEAHRRTGGEDEEVRPARRKRWKPLRLAVRYLRLIRPTRRGHALYIDFMRAPVGFQNREVEISGILSDMPHTRSPKHAHMEAILYILEGEGYSVIDGEKLPWKKGSSFHIQGPQTVHQHFNTGDVPSLMLRGAAGVRTNFFQRVARERFPYLQFGADGEPSSG